MVEIVPLDKRCGVIGPPVALARDSGQPSDGDLIARDAVYSARITRTYAAATTEHFGARIPTATSILSDKVSLILSAPINFETLAAQAQLLDAAGVVWRSKLAQLGRTREARGSAGASQLFHCHVSSVITTDGAPGYLIIP